MNKQQRETLSKAHNYEVWFANKNTYHPRRFFLLRDAMKALGKITLAQFMAWDKNSDYQEQDQRDIKEGFQELERIKTELSKE